MLVRREDRDRTAPEAEPSRFLRSAKIESWPVICLNSETSLGAPDGRSPQMFASLPTRLDGAKRSSPLMRPSGSVATLPSPRRHVIRCNRTDLPFAPEPRNSTARRNGFRA